MAILGYALVKCSKGRGVNAAPVFSEDAKNKVIKVGGEFFHKNKDANSACRHYNYGSSESYGNHNPQAAVNGVFVRHRHSHSMIYVPSSQKKRFTPTS